MRSDGQQPSAFKILAPKEFQTLKAIADRIFPKTETPGAVEIGALEYIDSALAGDYRPLIPLYRKGLRAIERYSRSKYGQSFHSLKDESKDDVLLAFEVGTIPMYKNAAEFFETLRYHIMEGIFCEPHYGGNRDMMGWRLVGFPGQQLGYSDAYIDRLVDIEPLAIAPDEMKKNPL